MLNVSGLINYWPQIAILFLFLLMFTLNRTVFSERDVRPVKDHIEDGWGKGLDESFNENQAQKRSACVKLTWFLVLIVIIVSIFK